MSETKKPLSKRESTYGTAIRLPKEYQEKVEEAAYRSRKRIGPFLEDIVVARPGPRGNLARR